MSAFPVGCGGALPLAGTRVAGGDRRERLTGRGFRA